MLRFICIVGVIGLLFTACSKNKGFPTVPQISLESINPLELGNGETLQIVLNFKDAEGDIQDSVFVREDVGYNYYDIFIRCLAIFPSKKTCRDRLSCIYLMDRARVALR